MQMPFRGGHEAAMVYSIVNEEPDSLEKYRSDVPSQFGNLIQRALEKVIAEGQFLTRDLGGNAMTMEFTDAIIHAL